METNAGVCPKEGKHMNKNVADDALRGLMGRRMPAWARYALVLAATVVFAVVRLSCAIREDRMIYGASAWKK